MFKSSHLKQIVTPTHDSYLNCVLGKDKRMRAAKSSCSCISSISSSCGNDLTPRVSIDLPISYPLTFCVASAKAALLSHFDVLVTLGEID